MIRFFDLYVKIRVNNEPKIVTTCNEISMPTISMRYPLIINPIGNVKIANCLIPITLPIISFLAILRMSTAILIIDIDPATPYMNSIIDKNNLLFTILVISIMQCHKNKDMKINLPGLFDRFLIDNSNDPANAPIAKKALNIAKSDAFPLIMSLIINGRYA